MVLPVLLPRRNYSQHEDPYKGLRIRGGWALIQGLLNEKKSSISTNVRGWIAPFLLSGSDSPWHDYQGMNENPEYWRRQWWPCLKAFDVRTKKTYKFLYVFYVLCVLFSQISSENEW